jgi:hypothetical protein
MKERFSKGYIRLKSFFEALLIKRKEKMCGLLLIFVNKEFRLPISAPYYIDTHTTLKPPPPSPQKKAWILFEQLHSVISKSSCSE